jgi:hypothetical protein
MKKSLPIASFRLRKRIKEKPLTTLPNNDDAADWLAKHDVSLY